MSFERTCGIFMSSQVLAVPTVGSSSCAIQRSMSSTVEATEPAPRVINPAMSFGLLVAAGGADRVGACAIRDEGRIPAPQERIEHANGLENSPPHDFLERLAGDLLDHRAEEDPSAVVVVVGGASREAHIIHVAIEAQEV